MLFTDTYRTLSGPATAEFKDRGSKFIAFAFPLTKEEEAKEIIKQLKKEHHQAAHHCWALVLGAGKEFQKSSDDREPANTAGKPILRAILSADVTNVLIVVVRYFGGKLLGVPGLIHAYGTAAALVLKEATLIEKILSEQYRVRCDFSLNNELYKCGKMFGIKLSSTEDGFIFEVARSKADALRKKLKESGIQDITFIQTQ